MRARNRTRRASPSQIAVRAHVVRARYPPILPSHGPAHRRADGSRLFVALAVDWFKSDGENGEVGDAPKLTKWSRGHGRRRRRNVSRSRPPFSHHLLRLRLSNYRRPPSPRELARQLNHLSASATNK